MKVCGNRAKKRMSGSTKMKELLKGQKSNSEKLMSKCFCKAQYVDRIHWRLILKWNVKKRKCYITGSLVVMVMNHRIPARKHHILE